MQHQLSDWSFQELHHLNNSFVIFTPLSDLSIKNIKSSKKSKCIKQQYTDNVISDFIGGSKGVPGTRAPGSKFFRFHAVFCQKNRKNNRLVHPLWELASPPLRKSWILHYHWRIHRWHWRCVPTNLGVQILSFSCSFFAQ